MMQKMLDAILIGLQVVAALAAVGVVAAAVIGLGELYL